MISTWISSCSKSKYTYSVSAQRASRHAGTDVRYIKLRPKELHFLAMAVKELRPKLNKLCTKAAQHELVLLSFDYSKLKLMTMEPDVVAREILDSDLLLACFDEI